VKTLTKIFGQIIDRLERHTSDDRHLGNGFGNPNFSASLTNFEFLHRLAAEEPAKLTKTTPNLTDRFGNSDCGRERPVLTSTTGWNGHTTECSERLQPGILIRASNCGSSILVT
jgi:hypothetical protein